jgi:hypothetical protein
MSDATQPRVPCPVCEAEVWVIELWRCECGRLESCQGCVRHVPEYHRCGGCGLDALDRALAKDDHTNPCR